VQRLYLLSYTHTLTLSNTHTLSLFSHSLTLSLSLCSEVRRQTCDLITLMDLGAASSQYYMFMEDDFRVYAPHRHPNPRASVSSSRASPPHRPREDGLDHPADTSITHLAAALALLSRWRLSKPERTVNKSSRASLQTGIGTLRLVSIAGWEGPPLWSILSERSFLGLGKGYITKEALDTPWCHYQTLAPTQEGEKDPLNSAFLDGGCTAPAPSTTLRIAHHAFVTQPQGGSLSISPSPPSSLAHAPSLAICG
jgi:hypothetical protein